MKSQLRSTIIFLAVCLLFANCNHNNQAKIAFDKNTVPFSILQGQVFKSIFKVKNTGNKNLNILNVSGDCSCTNIEYPKKPIPAGSTAEIKVTYNSNSDEGKVKKIIVVKSNTDPILHTLALEGVVNKIVGF